MGCFPSKDEKGITITKASQKFRDKYRRKLNQIWLDKGSQFYNGSMKSWLEDNDVGIYSTHNEEKSVLASISIS